jgi:hypothetical protein
VVNFVPLIGIAALVSLLFFIPFDGWIWRENAGFELGEVQSFPLDTFAED